MGAAITWSVWGVVHLDVTPPSPTVTGRQIRGRVTTAIVGTLQQVILQIRHKYKLIMAAFMS